MRMDGFAYVYRIGSHFNGQCDFTDHVAGVGADDTTADDAMGFGIKQQFGKAFIPSVCHCTSGRGPREQAFFQLDAFGFGLVVEIDRTVEIPVVGEGQRLHAQLRGTRHQPVDAAGAVEQGVVAMDVKVDEI